MSTTTPDITLQMLQADLREVQAHLAIWPDDKFGMIRLNNINGAIGEHLSKPEVPMMSHQRKRADLTAKPATELRQTPEQRAKYMAGTYGSAASTAEEWLDRRMRMNGYRPATGHRQTPTAPSPNPCMVCDQHLPCIRCVHASTATILARASKLPAKDVTDQYEFGPFEGMHEKTKKALNAEANAPRFTFGADYEMDQLWLEAERVKTAGAREDRHTLPQHQHTPLPELDKMMFPTMAFNLTSWDNVKYGTKNY